MMTGQTDDQLVAECYNLAARVNMNLAASVNMLIACRLKKTDTIGGFDILILKLLPFIEGLPTVCQKYYPSSIFYRCLLVPGIGPGYYGIQVLLCWAGVQSSRPIVVTVMKTLV